MNKKTFIIMTVLAVVIAGVAWWLSANQRPDDSGVTGQPLFPGLADRINDVSKITVTSRGDIVTTTLVKTDDAWTVEESGGYRADWPKVRTLLLGLSQADIVEEKTSRPEFYDRLGVQDISDETASGVLVRLDDNDALSLIVGRTANGAGTGRYVRRGGEAQALLVDETLELTREGKDWIEKDIIEFDAERIQEMYIRHPDGELVHVSREADGERKMVLRNVPEGREVGSPWAVTSLPNTLTSVMAEDVRRPTPEIDADVLSVLFIADNGLNIQLSLYQEGEENYWMRISANAEPTAGDAMAEDAMAENMTTDESMAADTGMASDGETMDAESMESEAMTPPDAAQEAAQINQRVTGWEYRVAEFKYNSWNKHLDDLLKPLDEAGDDTDGNEG